MENGSSSQTFTPAFFRSRTDNARDQTFDGFNGKTFSYKNKKYIFVNRKVGGFANPRKRFASIGRGSVSRCDNGHAV